jgi:glycosyltransferase involved in cell wall biosynthesis
LKVLHVYTGNLYGGVETMLVTIARYAHLRPGLGHEFALGWPGRLERELLEAGVTVHRYPSARLSRPWTVVQARRRLVHILKTSRPDVVVLHSNWPQALFGRMVRRLGVPFVHWLHDSYGGRSVVERLASRSTPDFAVANSQYNGELSLPRMFPGVRWEANLCACPAPDIAHRTGIRARVRGAVGTSENAVVIVQTSRLERWKGHAQLLAAARGLRQQPAWEIWFCGGVQRPHEQTYLDELQQSARDGAIESRVRFLGQRNDIPDVLASADIHCQANTGPEPMGLTFVEALYAGLPCVSMKMGGAAEIITPECGILVEPGSVEGLSRGLQSLIDDPSFRQRLGANGPARASELCDPARHLDRMHCQFERVLRDYSRSRQSAPAAK